MNLINFQIRPVLAHDEAPESEMRDVLEIFVDQRNLLDLVRAVEQPYAIAEGHPEIAGAYVALPAKLVLSDIGIAQMEAEKVSLYDCECGCPGCWPLLVKISASDDIITWSEFEQPHRGPNSRSSWWQYDDFGPFTFDRKQYEQALSVANSKLRENRGGCFG